MNSLMPAVNRVLGTTRPKSLMRTSFALILEQSPHPDRSNLATQLPDIVRRRDTRKALPVSCLNRRRAVEMFRLDYLSCLLTVVATILVGRKMWTGLVVSGVNSLIVCVIGVHTSQYGFIPANVFCICINAFNLKLWLNKGEQSPATRSATDGVPGLRRAHARRLWEAVRTDLIFRSEDSYRFLPDRVQEAAYRKSQPSSQWGRNPR
jgi:hypothetical protein